MGRSPCCDENGLKKGPWTQEEDEKLLHYIQKNGHGSWRTLPRLAGLNRCGKSCRLRWTNYLRPDIKRGKFSAEEEQTILQLHSVLGNKWSAIATHLPGRTDNEIKNFWNTHLKKRLIQMGFDPMTHRPRTDFFSALPQLIALAALREQLGVGGTGAGGGAAIVQEAAKLQYLQSLLQSAATTIAASSSSSAHHPLEALGLGALCSPQLTTTTTLDSSTTTTAAPVVSSSADDASDHLLPCTTFPAVSSEEGEKAAANHQQRQQTTGLVSSYGGGRADGDVDHHVFACHGGSSSLPPLTDLSDAASLLQVQVDGCMRSATTALSGFGGGSSIVSPLPCWPELFFHDDDPFVTDFL